MADTLSSVLLTREWQSIEQLTDGTIAAGDSCVIQNQGSFPIWVAVSETQPDDTFKGWMLPPALDRPMTIDEGENNVWLKCSTMSSSSYVNIQKG